MSKTPPSAIVARIITASAIACGLFFQFAMPKTTPNLYATAGACMVVMLACGFCFPRMRD
jgi:hypothetical protein